MKKYLALVSALLVASLTLAPLTKVYALGKPENAVNGRPEAAAKKSPPLAGNPYPPEIATATTTGGFIQSPYSSRVYDCRKVKHGALVLDEGVNKVFVRP